MSPEKSQPSKRGRGRPLGAKSKSRGIGTHIIWPKGLEEMYDISKATRCLWERNGTIPPRDVYVGGEPLGWKPETIKAAMENRISTRKPRRIAA